MIAFFFQLCIIYTLPFSIFFDGFLHSKLFCDACAAAFFPYCIWVKNLYNNNHNQGIGIQTNAKNSLKGI